jgi:hypothetical protein
MEKKQKPGTYEATVTKHGISVTKAGKPMATIRFKYKDDEGHDQFITWFGSFASDKATEITAEALAVCGMTSNNPADLTKPVESGVLDTTRKVQLTCDFEEYNGERRFKVKYVNPIGGASFRNAMSETDAVKAFAGLNVGGALAAARKKYPAPQVKNHAPTFDADEPIPF